jgi:cell division protein FtsQ
VVDAPVKGQSSKAAGSRRAAGSHPAPRHELADDYARKSRVAAAAARSSGVDETGESPYAPRRVSGLRFRLRGGVPRSWAGRLFAGALVLASLGGLAAVILEARSLLLQDPRLVLASSAAIELSGNQHLSRAQLLSVFGGDVERNLLTVPMELRRTELEALPWVEHATVMRLLPNHVWVQIKERTPVAFVREGSHIGLVDTNGVLLDLARNAAVDDHYSFPVVTGLNADDPLSTRAARMQLYRRFTQDLDSEGGAISKTLSEVDLTSPEDVKALVPVDGSAILVHFGEEDFLARYKRFEANLPGWKTQYPHLASVDMRYERQVVLEMAKGTVVPVASAGEEASAAPAQTVELKVANPAKVANKAKSAALKKTKDVSPPARAKLLKKSAAKAVTPKAGRAAAPRSVPPVADEPAWERRLNGTQAPVAKTQHLEKSFAVGGAASTQGQPQ